MVHYNPKETLNKAMRSNHTVLLFGGTHEERMELARDLRTKSEFPSWYELYWDCSENEDIPMTSGYVFVDNIEKGSKSCQHRLKDLFDAIKDFDKFPTRFIFLSEHDLYDSAWQEIIPTGLYYQMTFIIDMDKLKSKDEDKPKLTWEDVIPDIRKTFNLDS